MRKQIFALAIFAVLLVAAGGVVSMAQDTSTDAPTVPSGGIDILSGGDVCLDVGGGFTSLLCISITPAGPYRWSISGRDNGVSYHSPLDGSMYYEGGIFYIGIESFPVATSSTHAGTRYRGEIDPSGCGFCAWDNPMWGTSADTTWCVVSCASTPVATSGEDPNMG